MAKRIEYEGKSVELSIQEKAYRRGVHQALAMLGYLIDDTGIDARLALKDAVGLAVDVRWTPKECNHMLHKIMEAIGQKYGK